MIRKKGKTEPASPIPMIATQRLRSLNGGNFCPRANISTHSTAAPIVNRPGSTQATGRPISGLPLSTATRVSA